MTSPNPAPSPAVFGYRPEIDGLRALAVLPVVFYHAGFQLFSGGYVGVDVFFVISGFLITGILMKDLESGCFSLTAFYERRCRRILPPLVVMALVTTILVWRFFYAPNEVANFGRSLVAMATFWANILFYKQSGYFDAAAETKPLLHTWSLSVEEQFYLVFPILLFFLFKKFRGLRLAGVLIFLALVSFAASLLTINKKPDAVFYLIQFRAWELLLGSILAVWPYRPVFSRAPLIVLSLLGLAGVLGPAVFYTKGTLFPGLAALPSCLGTATLIFIHGRGVENSPVGRLLAKPILVKIGKISYSLYLWHWPLLVLIGPYFGLIQPSRAGLALIVALSFVLAWLSWRFVETPIRTRHILAARKPLFMASLCALALLVTCGRVLRVMDDFPFRTHPLPPAVARAEKTGPKVSCGRNIEVAGEETLPPCRFGAANGQPEFVFWGDSHAGAWLAGIEKQAEQYGLTGYQQVMAACPPLLRPPGDVPAIDSPLNERCRAFNASLEAFVAENGVRHVCLAAFFPRLEGDYMRDGPPDYQSLEKYLDYTAARLTALGVKDIWLVDRLPVYEMSLPMMVSRALAYGYNNPADAMRMDENDHWGAVAPLEAIYADMEKSTATFTC